MSLAYLPWNRPSEFDARPCVRDERVELTYAEFGERVDAVAEQFAERGVSRGSVVAIMLPNRVELLVAMAAAWRLGAGATPVNPVFTKAEATHQINDCDAALVVSMDREFAGDRTWLGVDELATQPHHTLPAPDTSSSDLGLLIYTSGSTGRPKGVVLNHEQIDAMVSSMGEFIGIGADDHCLLVLPLFHSNAINVSFLTPISVGAQLTVLERFHPMRFLEAIEQYQPTFFSAVPAIYSHLVGLPAEVKPDTGSVRFAICGAAPAPASLHAQVEERFGFPLVEGYGLSEGTCASTCNPLDGPRKAGSVGVALPGQVVAVMDPDGSLVEQGGRGEVVIKGANVMQGYLNQPEATADALGDGWLHTGDVGVIDEDGYLSIVDRIKDMIIRGGENIYPKEIENELHDDPHVASAAVIGGADERLGEVPVAFVTAVPGQEIDVDALLERCRENLTKIKVPVAIEVLDEMPLNPVGKIDKPALRSRFASLTPA